MMLQEVPLIPQTIMTNHGPLWGAAATPRTHIRVVTGLVGSRVQVIDPIPNRPPASRRRCALLAVGLLLVTAPSTATVFKWIDQKGVIHFSDSPPPAGTDYQARVLPSPRPRPTPRPAKPPKSAAPAPTPDGAADQYPPANPVVKDPTFIQVAEAYNQVVYTGRVDNEGEMMAHGVQVVISVVNPKGDICIEETVDVVPSRLAPGASGTYTTILSDACFAHPTTSNVEPIWR